MSQEKERSAIFKFFYVILSIVTFPIYLLLFVLRHPVLIIFLFMLVAGAAVYWPMSQGVALNEVKDWYQSKYDNTKREVVAKAKENGAESLVPQVLLNDVKRLDEEAKEALKPKGENYNKKIVRDEKVEEKKAILKKRGGFKKKVVVQDEANFDENKANEIGSLTTDEAVSGGLSQILQHQKNEAVLEQQNEVKTKDTRVETENKKTQNDDETMDLDLF